jgi:RNA polymerase sigma-70 factor, ECF subfamily
MQSRLGGLLRAAESVNFPRRERLPAAGAPLNWARPRSGVASIFCGRPRRKQWIEAGGVMDVKSREHELRTLMIAGLEGDATAHRALLSRLSGHLRAYFKGRLARIGRGPVDAEDLLQEVLIAIHTRRHTYDPSQLLTPWVHAVARYKFLDYLRRTKASIKDVPIENAEEVVAKDDLAGVESAFDLERLMAKVSPKARQAIQHVKIDGLTVSEAAAQSGMSESAVKVSIHRGLRALALLVKKVSQS